MKLLVAVTLAGLVAGAGLNGSAQAQSQSQTIVVWSYGFSPRPIQLVAGREVTLIFTNRSGSSHDFTASAFFANSAISAGDVRGGKIELGPHSTKSVTLVPKSGTYEAHCSHLFHREMGMSASILVE